MTTNRPLRVFLYHSSADKPAVRELYQKLRAEPLFSPWLNEEDLYPGEDWNLEIEKAIETSDVIIICLSNSSITKEGYVQKEIKKAIDYSEYKPDGTVFVIPLRLEECSPPKKLMKWQYIDFFGVSKDEEFRKLVFSLRKRSRNLGLYKDDGEIKDIDGKPIDNLIENAINFLRGKSANTFILQKEFRISTFDALRLLDKLESMGIVGPSKDREVLIDELDEFDNEYLSDD